MNQVEKDFKNARPYAVLEIGDISMVAKAISIIRGHERPHMIKNGSSGILEVFYKGPFVGYEKKEDGYTIEIRCAPGRENVAKQLAEKIKEYTKR
jgi:hypothetical protein